MDLSIKMEVEERGGDQGGERQRKKETEKERGVVAIREWD